jgi:excisionase family DNA binding protein
MEMLALAERRRISFLEAGRRLGVDPATVRRMVADGKLSTVRPNRKRLGVFEDEVDGVTGGKLR